MRYRNVNENSLCHCPANPSNNNIHDYPIRDLDNDAVKYPVEYLYEHSAYLPKLIPPTAKEEEVS